MRVVVIGCGRVGSGLAIRLAGEGHDVTVVDRDEAAIARLGPAFRGRAILGDGMDRDVLEAAGAGHADALAAATGSDEVNAVLSRVATTRLRVPRVVARMFDPEQAELYARLGVSTISPAAWGISRLHELLVLTDVASVCGLGGGDVDLVEFAVPERLGGWRVPDLEFPGEVRVAAVSRGSRTLVADAGTVLAGGDVVIAAVAEGSAHRIQGLLA
jgi:trk system potassium uptake protein TrkA